MGKENLEIKMAKPHSKAGHKHEAREPWIES